jgi:tetratricopeptide (TPR) repeat protein
MAVFKRGRTMGNWKVLRYGALVLGLGFSGGSGCQQFGPASWNNPVLLTGKETSARVGNKEAADVQVALGRSLEKRGDREQALAAYGEAIKRDSGRGDAYVRLAILHDQQGKFNESAEYFRKALQASPGNPAIFCDMGYSLYLQRRWKEAEMNLQQALVLKPDLARAHNNLGLVLARTDRVEEALAHFRKGGTESEAHLNLAFALTLERRWDDARDHYEKALAANPASEPAKNGLRELTAIVGKLRGDAQSLDSTKVSKNAVESQLAAKPISEPAKERFPELKAIVGKLRGDNQSLDTTKNPKSAVVSQPVLPQFHALPTEVGETEVPKVPVIKPVLPESHTLPTELPESKIQVAKAKLDYQPANSPDKSDEPGPQIINLREFQTVTAKEPSNAVTPEEKSTSKISVALTFFRLPSQEP